MKKMLWILIPVLLVAALSFGQDLLKSDEQKIGEQIENFITSYNSGDLTEIADCFDSRSRTALKAAMNMFGGSVNTDIGKFASASVNLNLKDLFGLSVGAVSDGDLLTVEVTSIEILDSENALAYADMRYKDILSESHDKVVFTMVKEGANWYIKDLENVK